MTSIPAVPTNRTMFSEIHNQNKRKGSQKSDRMPWKQLSRFWLISVHHKVSGWNSLKNLALRWFLKNVILYICQNFTEISEISYEVDQSQWISLKRYTNGVYYMRPDSKNAKFVRSLNNNAAYLRWSIRKELIDASIVPELRLSVYQCEVLSNTMT